MNKISPKSLLHSKWTALNIKNKEKHFEIIDVEYDDEQKVIKCIIEAAMTQNDYEINWRDLNDPQIWKQGWQ